MTEIISSRRTFLTGLGLALVAAPAIVRTGVLMPVKNMLILPDQIGDITFPIEGSARYMDWRTGFKPLSQPYELETKDIAEFNLTKWSEKSDRPHHTIPLDTNERWERMKARELQRRIITA